jgi:uncharacterized integral membrane protein
MERGTLRSETPVTQQVGRVAVAVIVLLFVLFAAVNAHHVEFHWIFGGTEVTEVSGERTAGGVPLIIVLFASFALGICVGWLWHRRGSRRKTRARDASDAEASADRDQAADDETGAAR